MATDDLQNSTPDNQPVTGQLLIGELIRRNSQAAPSAIAAWMNDCAITYEQLNTASNHFAQILSSEGIRYGDRLVCWADTCLEVLPLFIACAKMGVVFAPLNARFNAKESAPIVSMAKARLIISDSNHLAETRALISLLPKGNRPTVGSLVDALVDTQPQNTELIHLHANWNSTNKPAEYFEPQLRESDPQVIFFTSGSTGKPKGVVLSHRANHLRSFQGVFVDEAERSICMFPLFHMAAFTLALAAWQTRGEIAFVEPPSAAALLEAVHKRSATRLYCIPAVWNRILQEQNSQWNTDSLRYVDTGTSATPIELMHALRERFPRAKLRIYYGSTEVGAGTCLQHKDIFEKPGSVGLPSPGVELKLSPAGEICLRSDYLTDGYFEAQEQTNAVIIDGWFHTGDLGAIDSQGYLSIIGRMKEIIRTGGESVAPEEIESALRDFPGLAEYAVVGLPDPQWGEIICLAAVLDDSTPQDLNLDAVQSHCSARLASFKKPRRIEILTSLPRTGATGQVQRSLLIEQILSQNN